MGFFNKVWNFLRGKGFKEEEKELEVPIPPPEYQQPPAPQPVQQPVAPQVQQQLPAEDGNQGVRPAPKPVKKEPSKVEKELKSIEQGLKRVPSRKQYEEKINPDVVNTTEIQSTFTDLASLRPHYTAVFAENAKLTDPEILDILIQNREKLRHRFTARYTFYDANGEVAVMEVPGVLIEDSQHIFNHIREGQTYDYFKQVLDDALSSFQTQYGATGGNHTYADTKPVTVTSIRVNVTFA